MSEELNCMNCSIGDFKHDLCDCDNGFCEEFKSIGKQEDFFNAVMQRIRPQGEWLDTGKDPSHSHPLTAIWYKCSECGDGTNTKTNYCPNCGAKMKQ